MDRRKEELIRSLLDESGWIRITQEAAAASIGVSKRTYIRWIEEAKKAGLIVETSTNGRQFRLSEKAEQNQGLPDNVANVDNVDMPEKSEQNQRVPDNVDNEGIQNVANVDKNTPDSRVLSFPFTKVKEKNYINPRAREPGLIAAQSSSSSSSVIDYFLSVFPLRGFMVPTGVANVLARAEERYSKQIVLEAIDEIAMANGSRRMPNAAQLYGFCQKILARQNQKTLEQSRPYDSPFVPSSAPSVDREEARKLFEKAMKEFE